MKEFQAHSIILRARSLYFKSALSTRWVTKKNTYQSDARYSVERITNVMKL